MSITWWSDADLRRARSILGKYTVSQFREALAEIEEVLGREVSRHALRNAFLRNNLERPSSYCMEDEDDVSEEESEEAEEPSDDEPITETRIPALVDRLVQLSKKAPLGFADLCNKLDLSPGKTKALIEQARGLGIKIHVENDHVGFKVHEPKEDVEPVGIAPIKGQRQKIAVISDTHLGSKYCLRDQLKDFIHYAYEQGVREILHPGDVLDGMYRHGVYEVTHVGLDDQARDLYETLPRLKGLNYRAIMGNHDNTFTESSGVDVGHYLENFFRKRGRNDLHFYGNRSAFLKVAGAVVHLWHPRSGVSYARSYGVQKQIEKYTSIKPQILLTGHWHIFNYTYERAIHGIACPTFQGGGSSFSKSLGGSPAIGGLLLSWDLTEHGTIRSFLLEKRSYFEHERPVDIYNDVDATPVWEK